MAQIWKLIGARQASYGIGPTSLVPGGPVSDTIYETIRESQGDAELSTEYGRPLEVVGEIPDDASYAERFDALAALEQWGETWAEQEARIAREIEEAGGP